MAARPEAARAARPLTGVARRLDAGATVSAIASAKRCTSSAIRRITRSEVIVRRVVVADLDTCRESASMCARAASPRDRPRPPVRAPRRSAYAVVALPDVTVEAVGLRSIRVWNFARSDLACCSARDRRGVDPHHVRRASAELDRGSRESAAKFGRLRRARGQLAVEADVEVARDGVHAPRRASTRSASVARDLQPELRDRVEELDEVATARSRATRSGVVCDDRRGARRPREQGDLADELARRRAGPTRRPRRRTSTSPSTTPRNSVPGSPSRISSTPGRRPRSSPSAAIAPQIRASSRARRAADPRIRATLARRGGARAGTL